ncbi:MAG: hypothetical protein ISS82_05030 [Nanoarchaeota archaeon]|nr:hypothetical protein [Nanoarchaeota archaeon]
MKRWLHKIELIIDKIIPYLVVLLLFIIIGDFFFKEITYQYHTQIIIADYFIISIFVIDLIFKFYRVRKAKTFVKKYWLDIIAVFPFFLLFRVVEELMLIFRISGEIAEAQKVLHTGVEIEKIAKEQRIIKEIAELEKGSAIFKEIGEGTKFTRTRMLTRIFRLPRLIKAIPVYEKPVKKEYKIIKKEIKKDEKIIREDIKKIETKLGLKKRR